MKHDKAPENTGARPQDVAEEALRERIEQLSPEALDRLPFGVIRLDAAGRVTFYSKTEGEQSGFGDRKAIGQDFFTQMAPCLGTPEFLRRIERARQEATLDVMFEQIGDFDDAERELRVRVLSASSGGLWIFIQRP
jgi:photoactive yellow protein